MSSPDAPILLSSNVPGTTSVAQQGRHAPKMRAETLSAAVYLSVVGAAMEMEEALQ